MSWLRRKKSEPVVEDQPVEEPGLPAPPPLNSAGLRSMQDHMDYLLSLVKPLPPFGMRLLEAWDQTVCEDLATMNAVPPVDLAAVDGYAVRAVDIELARRDIPITLALLESAEDELPEFGAVPVVARTPMPPGSDAILSEQSVIVEGSLLLALEPAEVGQHVTRAGSMMATGASLMSSGERLDARHIGLLAGAGIDKVFVRPHPRVVVLSSGEDVVEAGLELSQSDQTWDANSFLIAAAAKSVGAQVWRVVVQGNDPEKLSETITDQLIRADLIISTTGSQRDYERIKAVLETLGQTDFTEVAMLPGKTQAFGLVGEDEVPMILLPGNPVSAYVSFQVFVRPILRKLRGINQLGFTPVRAIASTMLRSAKGQVQLMRGLVRKERGVSRVEPVHDSDPLRELTAANAFIVLDENTDVVRAGESTICWMLDED